MRDNPSKSDCHAKAAAPARAVLLSARSCLAVAIFGLMVLFSITTASPSVAQDQKPGAWNGQLELKRTISPNDPPAKPAVPWGSSSTTVQPARPQQRPKPAVDPAKAPVTFLAQLTQDGESIDQGLIWRVFRPPVSGGQPVLVGEWREVSPVVPLAPGDYVVNVGYGRAHATRKIAIGSTKPVEERLVLNAGGLRVTCMLAGGEKPSTNAISYDVFAGDADQLGDRVRIVAGLKPGPIVRLNAGLYRISAKLGDANAEVNADVTVEAGKLTDAVLTYHAARVTLKLVTRTGGEAQADTQWAVHTMQGDLVRESQGALPVHILAAGKYIASARHGGRLYQSQFEVVAGQPAQVEVVMR